VADEEDIFDQADAAKTSDADTTEGAPAAVSDAQETTQTTAAAATPLDEPDRISVTWSEETFCPVSYQKFGVGPFFMSTKVRPGETPEDALRRAWNHLDNFARSIYNVKRNGFIERLRASGDMQ
jgi:hypothetical protein